MGSRVGLPRSYRRATGEQVWEARRGLVRVGEDIAIPALRELRKEAGLSCAPRDLLAPPLTPAERRRFGSAKCPARDYGLCGD